MCHRRPSERTARETEREESSAHDREENRREAPVAADGSGGLIARARAAVARLTAQLV